MAEPALREQFTRLDRQREADRLGMLVFLATEVMLFGGLFACALALRLAHSKEYIGASKELHYWLGGINTAVLLTSSLLVAMAVETTREGRARLTAWLLGGAVVLAFTFLGIKAAEYAIEWHEGVVPVFSAAKLHSGPHTLFMTFYFTATGLHAVHVTAGIVLLSMMIRPCSQARQDRGATVIGNAALYWHLVDVVWIFLYPTLYLAR